MRQLFTQLLNDETGFIVSAELILIATIAVLSLVVGLSEIANAINEELEDVAAAFGSINQSFKFKGLHGHKGKWMGSMFEDHMDACDSECDITCCSAIEGEAMGGHDMGGGD